MNSIDLERVVLSLSVDDSDRDGGLGIALGRGTLGSFSSGIKVTSRGSTTNPLPTPIVGTFSSQVVSSTSTLPPTAQDDDVGADEDSPLSGNVLVDNGNGADSDPDAGDVLSVFSVNGEEANVGQQITLESGALLTVNADGTFDYDPNGQFEGLAAGQTATDSFTYELTDGSFGQVPGVFEASFELSSLIAVNGGDGSAGFVLNGATFSDASGISVSSAGDVNGDGLDDLIVGAYLARPNGDYTGQSYVVFGRSTGFDAEFELSSLLAANGGDGSNGFALNGFRVNNLIGISVSSEGDVNGDGFDDLIFGGPYAYTYSDGSDSYSGESYVVFGRSTGFDAEFELSSLLTENGGDGSNGFVLSGVDSFDRNGFSVSFAGDVNGDGLDDLIIGAPYADPNGSNSGESYVVFGRSMGFDANFELSSLLAANGGDGSAGFVVNGIDASDNSGFSVSFAGDVNGDGLDDLIIGARNASDAGESCVVFGRSTGFDASFELSSLLAANGGDGSNGFVLNGIDANDRSGVSVSSAGDVNGDGIDDLIIGAPDADPNGSSSGESYVVFGRSTGFGASVDFSALDGSNGFILSGIGDGDQSGRSVSSAGDVNGDGLADLIIGSRNNTSGESYVVFGRSSGFAANVDLSTLDGSDGFALRGVDAGDNSGVSVSSAGDVNGDGIDDLIIGAHEADPNGGRSGESYVVFGRIDFTPVVDVATVTVTIGGVDDAPDAQDDIFGTDEDTPVSGNVLIDNGNGADGGIDGGEVLSVASVNGDAANVGQQITLASGGLLTLNADGTFDYDPNGQFEELTDGETATDTFTYELTDGSTVPGFGSVASVTLVIDGTNDPLVAQDDNISTDEGAVLSGNVFADNGNGPDNDVDTDAVLSVLSVNDEEVNVGQQFALESGALLTLNADGSFDYDPNGQFEGLTSGQTATDSFTYELTDGSFDQLPGNFGPSFELSSLLSINGGDGANGFVLNGIGAFDNSGISVSSAGDVNGDGLGDLIIGAPYTDSGAGESYVVFGRSTGFDASFELSSLFAANGGDGSVGFVLSGVNASDRSGRSISSAGDVNGDGIDDLIIGARDADPNGSSSGESYVVFGRSTGFDASFELSSLLANNGGDGSDGFVLNGIDFADDSGYSVSSAGDVNGDGIDDLIIGAPEADPNGSSSGESYVVFGRSTGFGASFELSSLLAANGGDGSNGFVLNGIGSSDDSGFSVSSAGDVNGDGLDDLIIGARFADPNGNSSGESYVVFGRSLGFNASLELSTLDGSNGFVLNGIDSFDQSGRSVSSAGDVNGDGIDDLIIGASGADPNGAGSGESYVVFGRSSGFDANLELSTLNGSNGFIINGVDADDEAGGSVSSAGDVNGDGIDDLIIGARDADPNGSYSGESYVVFGRSSGFDANLELSTLDGSNGFVLNGVNAFDVSGGSVSSAGDVNGDGIDDLIIGARGANPNSTNSGESYVVFGRVDFAPVVDVATVTVTINGVDDEDVNVILGTDGRDILTGTDGDDEFRSFGGLNDRMTGGAGADVFVFGAEVINGARERDFITDYEIGVDTILLEEGAVLSSVSTENDVIVLFLEGDGDAIFIDGEGLTTDNLSIVTRGLADTANTLVGSNGDDQLFGGSMADTIVGGGGSDSLFGGDGNDVLVAGSADADSLIDFGM